MCNDDDVIFYKFHKAIKTMRKQSLTLFDGIKTVQNIDLYLYALRAKM